MEGCAALGLLPSAVEELTVGEYLVAMEAATLRWERDALLGARFTAWLVNVQGPKRPVQPLEILGWEDPRPGSHNLTPKQQEEFLDKVFTERRTAQAAGGEPPPEEAKAKD